MSERQTFAGGVVTPVYVTDITVTSGRLHPAFDLQFGVRNLFDRQEWDPASPDQGLDRLARDGRRIFLGCCGTPVDERSDHFAGRKSAMARPGRRGSRTSRRAGVGCHQLWCCRL